MKNQNSTNSFIRIENSYLFSIQNVLKNKLREKYVRSLIVLGSFLCLSSSSLLANNVVIGTPTVVGGNLQFTIQWDNSWNTALGPGNYDAVWVFVKRQVCGGTQTWNHSLLSTVSGNHSVTGGVLQVDAVSDGVGVFIRAMEALNIHLTELLLLQQHRLPVLPMPMHISLVVMVHLVLYQLHTLKGIMHFTV